MLPIGPQGLGPPLREPDRCLVMGIVNVTPDSFSDGGLFLHADDAIRHGLTLRDQGADLVDVGGESTRPGAERVTDAHEVERVLPVVAGLAQSGVAVSIDTMRAGTAAAAVAAGAVLVNDVSGGQADPAMTATVADLGVPFVAMHWRAHSRLMSQWASYGPDVVGEVVDELTACVDAAMKAGVDPARIVIDPGLGFAKEAEHNWALLAGLDRLVATGFPVLVGASRKRFLGQLLAREGEPRPVAGREAATAAVSTLSAAAGAWCVRVHDVQASRDSVAVVRAWQSVGLPRP